MIAISNAGLANLGKPPVDTSLATWVFTSVADYTAKTVTVTSATTVTSPETYKHANIVITDEDGNSVYGAITTRTGNTGALDVSGLKQTGNLKMKVTAISSLGIIAAGLAITSATALTVTFGDYEISFTTAAGI